MLGCNSNPSFVAEEKSPEKIHAVECDCAWCVQLVIRVYRPDSGWLKIRSAHLVPDCWDNYSKNVFLRSIWRARRPCQCSAQSFCRPAFVLGREAFGASMRLLWATGIVTSASPRALFVFDVAFENSVALSRSSCWVCSHLSQRGGVEKG